MTRPHLLMLAPLAVIAAACLQGCGQYTMESQYRPGITTVFVPIWTRGKDVYRRDLEMRLTEAIQKRIELDTPYKIASKDRADTELTGQIVRVGQQVLSKNPETGLPRDLEVTFTVSFIWKDLRTGKILVQKDNLPIADTYITHSPINEDFFEGSEGAINRVAMRVVEHMEADWSVGD